MKTQNELVKEFFSYLDYTEESDFGREFHPVHISCCRCMMMKDIEKCLIALRESTYEIPK